MPKSINCRNGEKNILKMADANKIFFVRYKIIDHLREALDCLKFLTDDAAFL